MRSNNSWWISEVNVMWLYEHEKKTKRQLEVQLVADVCSVLTSEFFMIIKKDKECL